VMIATPAIRALIRDNKSHQIMSIIQTSAQAGMQTMNQSLFDLNRNGTVSYEDAVAHTSDASDFHRLMERAGIGGGVGAGMGGSVRRGR
jgi:twitching motility protein PilT